MKKKVLFFALSKKNYSGSQKMIYNILANLDRNKFQPELIVQGASPLGEKAKEIGIQVHYIPFPKILNLSKKLRFKVLKYLIAFIPWIVYSIKVYRLANRSQVSIIWCANRWATFLSWLTVFRRKIKIVSNIWSPIYSRLHLSALSILSNAIIVETFAQKQLFNKIHFKPDISVIYTGIDEKLFEGFKSTKQTEKRLQNRDIPELQSKIIIGSLSGCRYDKGFDIIVDVAYELIIKQKKEYVVFVISGKSQTDDLIGDQRLTTKIKEMGNNFIILDWVENPKDFYKSINIYMSASRKEGLPGAVREAMGFSVPVIATDVGGSREAIGDTGLVLSCNVKEKSDVVVEFSEKLSNLIDNDERRIALGKKANKRMKKLFIGNKWVKEVESVFHKV